MPSRTRSEMTPAQSGFLRPRARENSAGGLAIATGAVVTSVNVICRSRRLPEIARRRRVEQASALNAIARSRSATTANTGRRSLRISQSAAFRSPGSALVASERGRRSRATAGGAAKQQRSDDDCDRGESLDPGGGIRALKSRLRDPRPGFRERNAQPTTQRESPGGCSWRLVTLQAMRPSAGGTASASRVSGNDAPSVTLKISLWGVEPAASAPVVPEPSSASGAAAPLPFRGSPSPISRGLQQRHPHQMPSRRLVPSRHPPTRAPHLYPSRSPIEQPHRTREKRARLPPAKGG
jgi:hypothetical protein